MDFVHSMAEPLAFLFCSTCQDQANYDEVADAVVLRPQPTELSWSLKWEGRMVWVHIWAPKSPVHSLRQTAGRFRKAVHGSKSSISGSVWELPWSGVWGRAEFSSKPKTQVLRPAAADGALRSRAAAAAFGSR